MVLDGPDRLQIPLSRLPLVDHVDDVLRGQLQEQIEEVGEQLAQLLVVAPFQIDEREVKVGRDELGELPEELDLAVDFFLVERLQQLLSFLGQEDGQLLSRIHISDALQVPDELQCFGELRFGLLDLCQGKRELLLLDRQHDLPVPKLSELLPD